MVSPGGGGMSGTLQKSQANAAFVSRIMAHEQLAKILAWRSAETTYIFYNVGRAFVWADYNRKPKEPLSYIVFKEAYVNCHDVNMLTRENMDTIIGFNTGDVMWYSPISGKFSRFNRGGLFNRSSVTCVKWMPGSENMFIAGYEDGSVITYDKEKDDQTFTFPQSDSDSFFVCKPHKNGKHNPASWWQVGRRAITAISFSPDCQHVAVTSMDGTMKVIDYTNERLLDTYRSFFGGLLCVCWSPDGRFILTGGQDDLVTVWAFRGRIVARCQGHHSWVTGVSFDAHRCTDRSYRFGSVGEDTRLCLWDFSVSSLHRPKGSAVQAATARRSRADFDKHTDIVHPVLSRREVALLEPFLSKIIHNEPLFSIVFREDAVVTTDRIGAIRVWARPPTLPS
ncbi:WD40-repeat-containing domain protein [Cladochytrium replicatum]|nr:WD40-repeat-containing domain protein [Cladochytrium replicatum]